MTHGLPSPTPIHDGLAQKFGCEWLADCYQKHPTAEECCFFTVVNSSQKSKKDLRKENPVIAGGIFSFLFDDNFL
jgi:hypothetical protein